MNREIKFRALYDGVWYYQTLEEIITITLAAFRLGLHKTQFTVIHDKNGVEIYDGDIITDGDGNHFTIENWEGSVFRIVMRNGMTWEFMYNAYAKGDLHSKYEVIGNVFENPELLTP